jgi:hypothetical protein
VSSGDVATLTATTTAPGDQRTPLAFMQFVATDTVSPGYPARDLTIAFKLAPATPSSPDPAVKRIKVNQ